MQLFIGTRQAIHGIKLTALTHQLKPYKLVFLTTMPIEDVHWTNFHYTYNWMSPKCIGFHVLVLQCKLHIFQFIEGHTLLQVINFHSLHILHWLSLTRVSFTAESLWITLCFLNRLCGWYMTATKGDILPTHALIIFVETMPSKSSWGSLDDSVIRKIHE